MPELQSTPDQPPVPQLPVEEPQSPVVELIPEPFRYLPDDAKRLGGLAVIGMN